MLFRYPCGIGRNAEFANKRLLSYSQSLLPFSSDTGRESVVLMHHINSVYTQRVNHAHRYDGHLFRGRYKSILADECNYLLQSERYIGYQHKAGQPYNRVSQPL